MDDLYVFAYKMRNFSQPGFFQESYYACSGFPGTKKQTEDNLNIWRNRGFAELDTSVMIPLYMDVSDYKRTIGDSTFCTRAKVQEFLVLNAQAAQFNGKIFPLDEYKKILKIPLNVPSYSSKSFAPC